MFSLWITHTAGWTTMILIKTVLLNRKFEVDWLTVIKLFFFCLGLGLPTALFHYLLIHGSCQ